VFDRVVLLTGMPRSGTSWLSQIFDSSPHVRFRLSPLFSYDFKNALNEASTAAQWRDLLQKAYESRNEFMDQSERRRNGQYPTFAKKLPDPPILVIKDTRFHNLTASMLERVPHLKVVALVRHPCGAIHSWLTTPGEFPAGADPLTEWRSGACRKTGFGEYWGFDDWQDVTRMHLRLAATMPDRVILQSYETLARDATAQTQALFRFCGIPYEGQTADFLRRSQGEHHPGSYAVYKNPDTACRWRAELQPSIRDAILAELRGTELERFAP
jgi:hypothetical protein